MNTSAKRKAWTAELTATLSLVWPIVLTNVAQTLMGATDVWFLSKIGPDALAAVLNPYDTQLIQDLEDVTGCVCHRYLVAPSDFDATLAVHPTAAEELVTMREKWTG